MIDKVIKRFILIIKSHSENNIYFLINEEYMKENTIPLNEQQCHLKLTKVVTSEFAGMRLDQALSHLFPEYSRSRLQQWIKEMKVWVNGKSLKAKDKIHGGEEIILQASPSTNQRKWEAQDIHLNIVFEDADLMVINKPAGLVVHPAAGNWEGTLVNALLHHKPDLKNLPRAGLIHRLDKDTTGLLIIAKTLTAHTSLTRQLQERSIKREYATLVTGNIISGSTINAPITRHPRKRKLMAVCNTGKIAITHYRVQERFRSHTLLKVNLETGRTHQIRVHMAYIQHPVLGDMHYAGRLQLPKGATLELSEALREFKRQALHARILGIIHPLTQEYIEWEAPLPEDMKQLLTLLRNDRTVHESIP
ncbi:MAG: Ribosomal large subunit pseudouridine synthase D [Legionellaceae bacterium]